LHCGSTAPSAPGNAMRILTLDKSGKRMLLDKSEISIQLVR
jgi:hypothetical protein